MEVDLDAGIAYPFITQLASTIDVIYRVKANGASQFLALEYSLALPQGKPGRLLAPRHLHRSDHHGYLPTPSAMAFDEATNNLYITSRANGTVLMINVEK